MLCLGLFSCYDENGTYGSDLVDSAFRNVRIDTSTVVVTSVLIDSLETSGKNVALVGRYKHSLWGVVSSHSFIAYERPSYGTDPDETVVLDSLVLSLAFDGRFVGDTTLQQTLSIYQLTEKIVLNDNGYLYNNSSVSYAPEALAVCSFKPKPKGGEKLEVRLPDALGQDLLSRFHAQDQAVSEDRFEDYFKGVAIVPDLAGSESLLTFTVADSSAALVLHYHLSDELSTEKELWFFPNTDTQFNHIDHDRSGTDMAGYPMKGVEIPSAELGNRGVLFGGLGWYTRLEFPYLNNLMQQGTQVEIESALLKIYPEQGTYSDYNTLPDSLYLYIADENNVVTDAVTDYLGSEVQRGTLSEDNTFNENTYYYFDVTQFMQEELGAFGMYKHNLQLVFNSDDYTGTFKNLTFNDQGGRNPELVNRFYNERRKQLYEAQPNAGHYGLAELEKDFDVRIITQNIDDLHERAGSTKVLHLHGELKKVRSSWNPDLIFSLRSIGERHIGTHYFQVITNISDGIMRILRFLLVRQFDIVKLTTPDHFLLFFHR